MIGIYKKEGLTSLIPFWGTCKAKAHLAPQIKLLQHTIVIASHDFSGSNQSLF